MASIGVKKSNLGRRSNGGKNQICMSDLPIHGWYQFVLGYPPHLVTQYLNKFNISHNDIVLDPFCGTGTTNVECLKSNILNYGIEANPIAHFAAKVKTNMMLDVEDLYNYLGYIYNSSLLSYKKLHIADNRSIIEPKTNLNLFIVDSIPTLKSEKQKILPKGFISDVPLNKVLILKKVIDSIEDDEIRSFFKLSLANLIINRAGNIAFGPEIYRTKPKEDINALDYYVANTQQMIEDVSRFSGKDKSRIIKGDARKIDECLPEELMGKINCVITSPPYPNEKDYTRSTRLESILLDFINNKRDLRNVKEDLLRSNSRNIFSKDTDGNCIAKYSKITDIADEIETKRIDLNKTSGFEKMYHKIVRHYFGGMYLHLKSLKPYLSEDAKLAYVLGDQMSFFRVYIPTAELIADIAGSLGYNVMDIELWRTRIATATKMNIDENVLILKND